MRRHFFASGLQNAQGLPKWKRKYNEQLFRFQIKEVNALEAAADAQSIPRTPWKSRSLKRVSLFCLFFDCRWERLGSFITTDRRELVVIHSCTRRWCKARYGKGQTVTGPAGGDPFVHADQTKDLEKSLKQTMERLV